MTILGRLIPDTELLFDVETADTRDRDGYNPQRYGISPIFVFDTEQGGYVTYGRQALVLSDDQQSLITWIQKIFATPRGVYDIYPPEYGTSLDASTMTFYEMSGVVQEEVRRCLLQHPLISSVTDITLTQLDRDAAALSFTVIDTINGATTLQVAI